MGDYMSVISVGTTLTTGLIFESDLNGNLVIKTGSASITSATFEAGGSVVVGAFTATSVADTAGNLRAIPQTGSAKTSAYTLAISDVGEYVQVGSGGSVVVPNSIFSNGDVVLVVNNTTGNISIDCPITTAYAAGTNTDRASITLSTRGVANVLFIANSICIVSGNIT